MKNNTMNIETVSTTSVKVQTYSWERFGNNIFSAVVALCELIHNAYAACLHLVDDNHVDISIVTRKSGTYLYVKNNGYTADLQRVLDYGRINHGTVLNQWGTGFKTAASFFNPTNDGWAFYTRDDEHVYRARAPFSDEMVIEELTAWPFDSWAISCVEIKIADGIDISGITANEIGYRYAYAIQKGLNITFNKKQVRAIMPIGKFEDEGTCDISINGENVQFTYDMYTVTKDDGNRGYFCNSQEDQGVYIYVNNCFAEKVGVSILKKRQRGGGFLKNHPSMNGLICVMNINVPDNHKADVPFINAKCNINWNTEIGKQFVAAINDCVGEVFFEAWRSAKEAERREYIDIVCSALARDSMFYYAKEVAVGNGIRADAVMYKEHDEHNKPLLSSIDTVVEYKSGKITGADVGQAFNYVVNLNACHPNKYGISRRILLVGTGLSDDAKCVIDEYRKHGYIISWMPYGLNKEEIENFYKYAHV